MPISLAAAMAGSTDGSQVYQCDVWGTSRGPTGGAAGKAVQWGNGMCSFITSPGH